MNNDSSGASGEVKAIADEAWSWYNNPVALGGLRPRNLLPLTLAYPVAQALGHPLIQAELETLLQTDGSPVVCHACHREFQPVRWVVIDGRLISALAKDPDLSQFSGRVVWAGSRIVHVPGDGQPFILQFCGGFYYYDHKQRDRRTGGEFYCVSRQSCLGAAYLRKENQDESGRSYPTYSLGGAEELVARLVARHEWMKRERAERIRREEEDRVRFVDRGVANAFQRAMELRQSNGRR